MADSKDTSMTSTSTGNIHSSTAGGRVTTPVSPSAADVLVSTLHSSSATKVQGLSASAALSDELEDDDAVDNKCTELGDDMKIYPFS